MLEKQKVVEGECHITTVLFDNNYERLHDQINIKAVSSITNKEHYVGVSTALPDINPSLSFHALLERV